LKQSELGKLVGLSQDSISDIERGKALTTLETFIDLAQYFNVSADYLLGLDDVPNRRDANNH
jgi:transcriptional regulator with XRE-family HTH domain